MFQSIFECLITLQGYGSSLVWRDHSPCWSSDQEVGTSCWSGDQQGREKTSLFKYYAFIVLD